MELDYSIEPRGLMRVVTSGNRTAVESGYCVLDGGGAPVPVSAAVIRFSGPGLQSETGVPFVVPSSSASLYWERSEDTFTGIAFANNSSEPRRVLRELFLRSGVEQKLQLEIDLPPHAHLARLLTELFPESASGQGLLRYSSDGPVGFLALRTRNTPGGDQLTSSVDLGDCAGSGDLIFPQLAVGGGYEMRFVVLNPGDITAEGRLEFYDSSGARTRMLFK